MTSRFTDGTDSDSVSVLDHSPDGKFKILDETGHLREGAEVSTELSDGDLIEMYQYMRLGQYFDEKAVSLQRQGRMETYALLSGHEGSQVGSAFAMDEEDWLLPSYRKPLVST